MPNEILFNKEAKLKLKAGIDKLANAVKVTLGAKGRNVIIQQGYAAPHVTKDGVTVARSISLADPIENMGAEMIKEVAGKVVDVAGDGTTTATILAQAIFDEGLKALEPKQIWWRKLLGIKPRQINPIEVKRGIDIGVEQVTAWLKEISIPVSHDSDYIESIATISANNDPEIGKHIAEAMRKVSSDGVITIDESKTSETYVDTVEGVQFINGLLSPYFVTNVKKSTAEFDNPLIMFIGKKVVNTKEILVPIEMALKTGRPLVIVANDFEGEVIATLAKNKVKGGYQIAAVRSPSYGQSRKDYLEDLALVTGGVAVAEEKGIEIEDFTMDFFGTCDKVEISRERTTIIGGKGDPEAVAKKVQDLKTLADNEKQEFDEKEVKKRISKLVGGVGVIYVGANSEAELKERKDRFDDALAATKAAVDEGVVAGGGITLLNASDNLPFLLENDDQVIGLNILLEAMRYPFNQIIENAGMDSKKISEALGDYPSGTGYDVKNDDYCDMVKSGIIDPKKVTRVALESAASVASLLLTTEATVFEVKE